MIVHALWSASDMLHAHIAWGRRFSCLLYSLPGPSDVATLRHPLHPSLHDLSARSFMRRKKVVAQYAEARDNASSTATTQQRGPKPSREKKLCYYFTQGRCTMEDSPEHLKLFSHKRPELPVRPPDLKRVKEQQFDRFLVLDLEGKVEILEFPVILVCSRTLRVLDHFHRCTHTQFLLTARSFMPLPGAISLK